MKKIKVLHVTGTMNRGGAEVMLMDIYRHISKDLFHFNFLINYHLKTGIAKGDFDDEILSLGAQMKYIGTQWDLGPTKYFKVFKSIIEETGTPDIVHIHLNAKSGIIALAAKKAGVKKVIVHSHADLKFRGSLISRTLSTAELQFQKFLIASYGSNFWGCSQEANDSLFYKRLQTKGRSAIINNAVDVNAFQSVSQNEIETLRRSYGGSKDTLVVGNIGRIVKHKNVLFIMYVLNELSKRKVDFRFVFAGRAGQASYLEEIKNKAEEFKISDRVIYLGVRDDVPVITNTFDVFVGPALKEGFGLVAVEAQAAGVPCVLYTGFPGSVDMGMNLVTFLNEWNVEKWADAILRSRDIKLTDKGFIKNKIADLGFDIISNVSMVEELYRNILK
ncbi:MAG: glycosyltransferase [Ginsengibacter sp.]